MNSVDDYLNRTRSAVEKLFTAVDSYYLLLSYPKRPVFVTWDSDEARVNAEYEKWAQQNSQLIQERLNRDDEFAQETFAITTLCSAILQFAYMAIKQFSRNVVVPTDFQGVIKPDNIAARFCIGRLIDDVPIGLIIYAGRNQSHHYDETTYREPTPIIFSKLANWYSPQFQKHFVDDRYDLANPRITNFAAHILHKLDWHSCDSYENDIRSLFPTHSAP